MGGSGGREASALFLIKYAGGGLTWLGAESQAEIGKANLWEAKREDGKLALSRQEMYRMDTYWTLGRICTLFI